MQLIIPNLSFVFAEVDTAFVIHALSTVYHLPALIKIITILHVVPGVAFELQHCSDFDMRIHDSC